MSTPDTHIWRTGDDAKIMIGLRGTSTNEHVLKTWPVIGLSLENIDNHYVPYFNHFTKQSEHIKNVLDLIGVQNYENLSFVGHSMGGTAARINQRKFKNSKAYTFDQGAGIFTSPITSKLAKMLINSHIGQIVELSAGSIIDTYMIPLGVSSGTGDFFATITKQYVRNKISDHIKQANFLGNNRTEHHRTQYDVVSLLSSGNNNTFMYQSKGKLYDMLGNHDMKHLMESVLNSTNQTSKIFVKGFEDEETTFKEVIKEIAYDIISKQIQHKHKQSVNIPNIDFFGRRSIGNLQAFTTASRGNFVAFNSNPFVY
jgi:hypothetical protein